MTTTVGLPESSRSQIDRKKVLQDLGGTFEKEGKGAERTARRAALWSPALSVTAAVGTAFAGAAVAISDLSNVWRTVVIIIAFLATGIGAGAAALRPTERAQAAKADVANTVALKTWLEILRLDEAKVDDAEFRRRVQALQTWRLRLLGTGPYTYDETTPWSPPDHASGNET